MSSTNAGLSARSYREDPDAVRLVAGQDGNRVASALGDAHDIAQRAREAQSFLIDALQPGRQAVTRATFARVTQAIRSHREMTECQLMVVDGMRAAARVIGECLAGSGRLEEPSDVLFLFIRELLDDPLSDRQDQIAHCRALYGSYQGKRSNE